MITDVELKFVDDEITPCGVLSLLIKLLEKCKFEEVLSTLHFRSMAQIEDIRPNNLFMLYLQVFGVGRVALEV